MNKLTHEQVLKMAMNLANHIRKRYSQAHPVKLKVCSIDAESAPALYLLLCVSGSDFIGNVVLDVVNKPEEAEILIAVQWSSQIVRENIRQPVFYLLNPGKPERVLKVRPLFPWQT